MFLRLLILITTFLWLVFSIPQDMFLWVSTTHEEGSFDWLMGMGRALLIGFLPLLIAWVEGELDKRHTAKATKSYNSHVTRERKKPPDQQKISSYEDFGKTYTTPESVIAKVLPRLFGLIVIVIAISYYAYYDEFGKDLSVYQTVVFGVNVGGFAKAVILGVRVGISAVVTYALGKLSSAMDVNSVFGDVWKNVSSFVSGGSKPIKSVPEDSTKRDHDASKVSVRELARQRRESIISLLQENIDLNVENLSQRFGVSGQTIRNDYKALENMGRIVYADGKVSLIEDEGEF